MADKIQPLQSNIPIVDKVGQPTDYFIRYMQQQLGIGFIPSSRIIGTGKGLTGGGDLTKDRTISLDATLGDLNDVDETTNPPTDGQVLTFIGTDGKWEPADATGGGGSTGEAAWKVDAVGTGAPQNVVIPDIDPTKQRVMVFVNGLRWQTTEYTIAGNIVTLTTNSAGDSIEIVGPLGKADGTAFVIDAVGTGAPQNVNIPFPLPTTQSVMVFVNGLRWQTTEYTIAGNIVTLTTNSAGDSIEIVGPLGFVTVGAGYTAYDAAPNSLPKVADFTQVNFTGTTTAVDGNSALVLSETTSGNQILRLLEPTAMPAVPWRAYARIKGSGYGGSDANGWLFARNAGTTKITTFGNSGNGGGGNVPSINVTDWNSITGGGFASNFVAPLVSQFPQWFSIENDGVNLNTYTSPDGKDWDLFQSVTLASFLGSAPVCGLCIINGASKAGIHVYSFGFTAP